MTLVWWALAAALHRGALPFTGVFLDGVGSQRSLEPEI